MTTKIFGKSDGDSADVIDSSEVDRPPRIRDGIPGARRGPRVTVNSLVRPANRRAVLSCFGGVQHDLTSNSQSSNQSIIRLFNMSKSRGCEK